MDPRERLAEMELMEKLALLEGDESASPESQTKVASDRGGRISMDKLAEVMQRGRQIGRLRAEADFAAFLRR